MQIGIGRTEGMPVNSKLKSYPYSSQLYRILQGQENSSYLKRTFFLGPTERLLLNTTRTSNTVTS